MDAKAGKPQCLGRPVGNRRRAHLTLITSGFLLTSQDRATESPHYGYSLKVFVCAFCQMSYLLKCEPVGGSHTLSCSLRVLGT